MKRTGKLILTVLILLSVLSASAVAADVELYSPPAADPQAAPVGFWSNTLVWNPGDIAIYSYKLYRCKETTTYGGNQPPAGQVESEQYWEKIGDMVDIFGLEEIVFPEWNDDRDWPGYAFVLYQGQYYLCQKDTTAGEKIDPSNKEYWFLCGPADTAICPPAAPVGYWHDFVIWNPGDIAIHDGKVYRCIAATLEKFGLVPHKYEDYWVHIGEEEDYFNIEGLTIPQWDDSRDWPWGAIVLFDGAYYMSMYNAESGLAPSNKDYWMLVAAPVAKYNFNVYMKSEPAASAGSTLYVDVVLSGDINYTQINTSIAYDSQLLEFAGFANLNGLAAEVKKDGADKISVRSVPSLNMMLGASCSTPVRVVTLKFTVKDTFAADSVNTDLSFAAILVYPAAGVSSTTAPGIPLTVTLQK